MEIDQTLSQRPFYIDHELRGKLDKQVETFLKSGGSVEEVEPNKSAFKCEVKRVSGKLTPVMVSTKTGKPISKSLLMSLSGGY